MILAFIAAGLKILSDSFLSGLGSGLAGLFVNKLESKGHHEIVAQLSSPGQAPEAQRQAAAILVTTVKAEPNFHDQVEQAGRSDNVAAPIALTFGNLFQNKPEVASSFGSGSLALADVESIFADEFRWTPEQRTFETTSHCPIGHEPASVFEVKYIDVFGKEVSPMQSRIGEWRVMLPDGRIVDYEANATCKSGHSWPVFLPPPSAE